MLPYDLKTWVEGESLEALEFNQQLEQNLEWVRKRNINRIVVRNGVSDASVTVAAGWQPLLPTVWVVGLNTKGGDIMISANLAFITSGASGDVTFDILVKGSKITTPFFLSTFSASSHGILFYEQYGGGYVMKKTLRYLWTPAPADDYEFTLYWLAGVGSATINYTNTVNEFIVEEYCSVYG